VLRRNGSISDLDARNREVRFTPTNRLRQFGRSGPKSANTGSDAQHSITSSARASSEVEL
jgi:hypothetical protein